MTGRYRRNHPLRGAAKVNAARTECEQGHPFDDANVYHYTDRDGYPHRMCRVCNRNRAAKRKAQQ